MRKTTEFGGLDMASPLPKPRDDVSAQRSPGLRPAAVVDEGRLARFAAMRDHLIAARPTSGNEALRVLRAAFPQAPLADRVEAASRLTFSP